MKYSDRSTCQITTRARTRWRERSSLDFFEWGGGQESSERQRAISQAEYKEECHGYGEKRAVRKGETGERMAKKKEVDCSGKSPFISFFNSESFIRDGARGQTGRHRFHTETCLRLISVPMPDDRLLRFNERRFSKTGERQHR